jgi:hypothetical protein
LLTQLFHKHSESEQLISLMQLTWELRMSIQSQDERWNTLEIINICFYKRLIYDFQCMSRALEEMKTIKLF